MKQPCQSVRVPECATTKDPRVKCRINGLRPVRWQRRNLDLGRGHPGKMLSLTFPIATRRVRETIGAVPYALEIRGNMVVSIDPPGKYGALYKRAAYRSDEVHWRKVKRFVSKDPIIW